MLAALDRAADKVAALHLESPVVFFLEIHKPLARLAYHLGIFCEPLLAPLFGPDRYAVLHALLSAPENIDKFIHRIEERSEENQRTSHSLPGN